MHTLDKEDALTIFRGALEVDPDDTLKEFKTKYKKWLLQGHHPDTGGNGREFDRVRQAYHIYVRYLTNPTNYQEFVANALANGNYCAAFTANYGALCGVPFETFYKGWKK